MERTMSQPPSVVKELAPTRNDARLYTSHPFPAADYAEAVRRVESKLAAEVGQNPECHSALLAHGARTARAIVFATGFGDCPAAFAELGAQFHERGYNVLTAPLPYDGL